MQEKPERKILILTGRLCARKIAESLEGIDAEVLELPIDVASLMTSNLIRSELARHDLSRYAFILVPGRAREDLDKLECTLGVPFYLGPVHFNDVRLVLENLSEQQLSKRDPADLVLKGLLARKAKDLFEKARMVPAEPSPSSVLIGSGDSRIAVGRSFPPSIIAEIVDLPRKSTSTVLQEAQTMAASGASIIDLGMIPGEDHPELIRSMVPVIQQATCVPVSVDTMREEEILAAADAGADLILSICGETLDLVPSIEPPVVLVPLEDPQTGRPRSRSEKLRLLARYSGVLEGHDVIVDPLLEPIGLGFSESLRAFMDIQGSLPDRPSLMGLANAVELADVDSIGMNATLAAIAVESGVNLLLTTEASPKTQGSVAEISKACQMMFYSVHNHVPPKNLGIDLLMYKEKIRRSYPVRLPARKIRASPTTHGGAGSSQQFHIVLLDGHIHAVCHLGKDRIDIIGTSANEIGDELRLQGLLPDPRHALYVGTELAKAELALAMGRSYIQDEPLLGGDRNGKEAGNC